MVGLCWQPNLRIFVGLSSDLVNRWGALCEDQAVESELCGRHSCVFFSFLKFRPQSISGKENRWNLV